MALSPGTRIGQYEVRSPLGAGGMGEVYRAHDSKLGRDVALKILPEAFAADPERLMRFEREARTLASLNHPHIAQVYGVEDGGATRALVMELVEGEDLSARLRRGPIPLDEALPIARQIADALEAAHEAGIIHRDLKPANIKLRADGTAKVLDFGLAKALEPGAGIGEPGTADNSPTITSPAMTMRGVILGTAAYMAPEQAKGKPVDKRADIWAFGAVLYEMLTGQPAFRGDDITDTLTAVLRDEPDWTALPTSTPAHVRTLLGRCLAKDPKQRLRDIGDARLEFDVVTTASSPSDHAAPPARPHRRDRVVTLASTAALAAAIAGAAGWTLATRSVAIETPAVYRSSLLIPDSDLSVAPPSLRLALSPDGRHVAYVGSDENAVLHIRPLHSLTARAVPRSFGAVSPFWSPDGREVAFFTATGLQAAAVGGGEPRTIAEMTANRVWTGGTWGPSGIVVAIGGGLAIVPASGGPLTTLLEPDPSAGEDKFGHPHFLPDGRRFLFVAYQGLAPTAIYLTSLDSPSSRARLMDGGSNVEFANGHLLYMRGTTLVAQPFDPATARLDGEPVSLDQALMPNVAVPFGGAFSASRTGAILYQQLGEGNASPGNTLVWRSRTGDAQPLSLEPANYRSLALARNRAQAIVGRLDDRGGSTLWLLDLSRGVPTRFTFGRENAGVFTPDGTTVIYNSARAGRLGLFRRRLDVGAVEEPVASGEEDGPRTPLSVSPDGQVLLYAHAHPATGNDLWHVRLDSSALPVPFLAGGFEERWAQFSPDGRWVVYESNESGRREIYVRAFSGGGSLTQVSSDGGAYPRWSHDGREIFFASAGKLFAASVRPSDAGIDVVAVQSLFDVTPPSGFRRLFYDVAADGRFLTIADTTSSGPTQLTLMLNWPRLTRGAP